MSRYYPITLNIQNKTCLVVGGGSVGARKAEGLLNAGARVRVLSREFTPELQALAVAGRIETLPELYSAVHLAGVTLVFAATNNRAVNAQIAADCQARHILVNVADAPEEGDFVVPSVVRRGELCISISTGGNNPMLAAKLAAELEARFGEEYGDFVELLGQMRVYIKERTEEPAKRRIALARLIEAEAELRDRLRSNQPDRAVQHAKALIDETLET